MTDYRALAIGRLLAKTVLQEFETASATTDPHSSKPALRLSGFEPDEIRAAIAELSDWTLPGHAKPIQLVVGSRDLPGLEGHLLPEGRTLTSYRNSNDSGLVLVEIDDQSDAQGIQQMHSITDRDLLGPAAGLHLPERLRWLYAICWTCNTDGAGIDAPASLAQELDQLHEWLITTSTPALRIWVDFVSATTQRLADLGRAIAAPEVRQAISAELVWLNLFPDDRLYDRRGSAARRLERNRHLSDLRNPQGKELRDDDLANRIDSTSFVDAEGADLATADNVSTRTQLHSIRDAGGPSADLHADFYLWEQLFEKKTTKTGVGGLILEFLQEQAPPRVEEFTELQIEDDLDDGDPEAAELLLTNEPPDGEPPLADLLPASLRKKVDRLVFRGEQAVTDPLIAILNGLKALPSDITGDDAPTITLQWEKGRFDDHKGEHSARLFGFLYGLTLLEVREASADNIGCTLEIDDRLLRAGAMATVFGEIEQSEQGDDSEDSDATEMWAPLQLALRSSDSKTPLIRFRWSPEDNPGLVLFARLVVAGGTGGQLHGPSTDEWLARAMHTQESVVPETEGSDTESVPSRMRVLAGEHLTSIAANGISAQRIGDYLDSWTPLLHEARDALVPVGGPLAGLDDVATLETGRTDDGHLLIFGTHPLRLRWLGQHLDRLAGFLRGALEGGLQLNSENDQLYFNWLDHVSPHRQPPLLAERDALYTAVREVGLHEEFAAVSSKQDEIPEWLGTVDSSSVDEIVGTIRSFVAAFPHKSAGLSVLLLSHGGADRLARRIVERLRKRDLASLDLELHVVTRSEDHDAVAATMAAFDSEEGRGSSLLPPFRLVLHGWKSDPSLVLADLVGRIDVAVAPNLFGLHSTPLAETRRRESGLGGAYDSWVDPSTHSRPPAPGSINVSQVLLPATPDPVLEAWSTLSVRRHTQQPLSGDDPNGTDFFTLQVQFDQNEQLFTDLHRTANWVVTLDPFIGRDQIDALNDSPDVITVRPGIGKNQMYTMVVSSTAGKPWVSARLRARLEDDFGIEPERAGRLASRLYEIGRQVVPGLMLRAVGLGRTIEEILGLILARYSIAAEGDGKTFDGGFEYWISLDEHTDWFGGANRVRPDLLRVRMLRDGDVLRVQLLVLESKFRQKFDLGVADDQIRRALTLFAEALATDAEPERHDTPFWQRELLTALDQLPRQPAAPSDLPPIRALGGDVREDQIRDDIRSGRYELDPPEGVVSVTAWSSAAGLDPGTETPGGHRLVAIDSTDALRILARIEEGHDPFVCSTGPRPEQEPGPTGETDSTPTPGPTQETAPAPPAEVDPADQDRSGEPPQADPQVPAEPAQAGQDTARTSHRMDPAALENQLQAILDRLHQLGVSVRRPENLPHLEGPGFCSYRVQPDTGVSAHNVTGKLEDLKLALELPADMSIRSFVDRGAVVFEVPKDDADRYFVDASDLLTRTEDDPATLSVPIGEDVHGNPVSIDFSSADTPHLLIAGTTGSGKSIALEVILRGLATRKSPESLEFLLVDGKGTELVDFEESENVRGEIGYWPDDAIETLSDAVEEMNRRNQLFRARKVKSLAQYNAAAEESDRIPWWLVVLDEYADLTSDPDERKQIESDLKRVAQKGRSAGIHLILATQKPSAEVLSTVVRSNLPAQLALRVKTASDSRIIMDESGAESLAGKGDAFLKTAKSLTRVQCAMVAPSPLD